MTCFLTASEKFSENLHIVANEPSLAFYRIQEHVRKSLPQLVAKKVRSHLQSCHSLGFWDKGLKGEFGDMNEYRTFTNLRIMKLSFIFMRHAQVCRQLFEITELTFGEPFGIEPVGTVVDLMAI